MRTAQRVPWRMEGHAEAEDGFRELQRGSRLPGAALTLLCMHTTMRRQTPSASARQLCVIYYSSKGG